uniref:Uncharacterized protein n=1 Tax=Anguilla anguilla TaxID=7936 RepID=A0A0E9VFR8_ANGAN
MSSSSRLLCQINREAKWSC